MTWKCHLEESTNGIYDMILGRDLITSLGLGLKFFDNVIIGGEGPYEGCSSPMVDVNNYEFKYITDKTVKPEDYFIKSNVNECLESDSAMSSTRRMRRILNSKYIKADLNKILTKKYQHLTAIESHRLLHLLEKF